MEEGTVIKRVMDVGWWKRERVVEVWVVMMKVSEAGRAVGMTTKQET